MSQNLPQIHLYVNQSSGQTMSPGEFHTITDALKALDSLAPLSAEDAQLYAGEKSFPAPFFQCAPAIIHIGSGTYREKLVIQRPRITLIGEDDTRIVYGQGAYELLDTGEKRGTFRTASVRIDAPDFTAVNITFQNDAGYGHTVGQALALYVDADRCTFDHCRLLGSQDTLFTAPLPLKEAQPGGFKGPGEYTARVLGRHYYKDCFIQGDVDFIFGSATAWFENCELFSKLPGDRLPPESPDDQVIYGYVTAASTYRENPYGYVFHKCRLTSDCPPHTIYLGRPWREYAKTVFLECEMGEHIHPAGWMDWGKPHGHFYYGEYHSTGAGAAAAERADFSHQLTDEEAEQYKIEQVLGKWVL